MAQPFGFGHGNYGYSPFLFLLAPLRDAGAKRRHPLGIYLKINLNKDHRPKGGNHWGQSDGNPNLKI